MTKQPSTSLTPAALKAVQQELAPLSARRKLDYLLARPDLRGLLARLPPQDVYAVVKEVGVADSLELLERCPPRTVQAFADLAVWRGDRMDPRQLAALYTALFAANSERATAQIMGMDTELCTLFLKLHTHVVDLTREPEPEEEGLDALTTPDNKYMVLFVDPPGLPEDALDPLGLGEVGKNMARQAAKQFVNALIQRDAFAASKVLDAVRWELPSALEEEALRWRTGRLQDLGFPPREEAVRAVAYLDPDTSKLNPPPEPSGKEMDEEHPDAALALFIHPDDKPREVFLAAALQGLESEEQDRRLRELASLCNRVATARGISPGEPEAVKATVREARALLDLGLAYRCGGDVTKARELMRTTALVDLFRVGNSLTLKLGTEARKVVQRVGLQARELGTVLDAPGGLALAALCARQPLFFMGLSSPGELTTRGFATLDDLAVAARSLAESAFRLAVGVEVLGLGKEQLSAITRGTQLEDSTTTLEVVLTTGLARALLGGDLDATPLSVDELQQVRRALEDDAKVTGAGHKLGEVVAGKVPLPGAPSVEEARARALTLSSVLLTRLRDEVKDIPASDRVDPRFVTRVLARTA
ncbi:MAG: DUF6178 family protein [Myxococcota bacterium]